MAVVSASGKILQIGACDLMQSVAEGAGEVVVFVVLT